jgi:hypothetical protein
MAVRSWLGDMVMGGGSLPHLSMAAVGAAAVLSAAACGSTGGAPPTATKALAHSQICPRLDSQLFQLIQSPDPERFASGARLDLNPSGVRVAIELAAGNGLSPRYQWVIEARYANTVQARVPLSNLCALASDASVVSVAPPALPILGSPRP